MGGPVCSANVSNQDVSSNARFVFRGAKGLEVRKDAVAIHQATHVLSGRESILRMREMLIEFSLSCGQSGTMEDITYFLTKPGLLKRIPKLYLIAKTENLRLEQITVGDLMGVVLLFEYKILGVGMRAFATNDRSGRGTMLALPFQRLKVAAIVSRALLDRGAHVIMLSFRTGIGDGDKRDAEIFDVPTLRRTTAKWARRERTIAAYLPLEMTYEGTLAKIGQRTRRNMRYYRRRAEAQLGCRFISKVEIDREEYLAFNRGCMFPVPDRVALWRLDNQKELTQPVLMGMKDKDGSWLSILGGRRHQDRTEILWQMNRDGLPTHSLSTAIRSYYIEHEIGRGMKRFYAEGGTAHSLHHSFVEEELTDLVVVRQSGVAQLMKKLTTRWVPSDNELAGVPGRIKICPAANSH